MALSQRAARKGQGIGPRADLAKGLDQPHRLRFLQRSLEAERFTDDGEVFAL
jgi:hypothetical protein